MLNAHTKKTAVEVDVMEHEKLQRKIEKETLLSIIELYRK